MKRISKDKRAEIIRLRVQDQLSTPEISRRTGVCNFSIYRILKDKPWLPNWPVMKAGPRATWSPAEVKALTNLWPCADDAEIVAALPNRKWANISKKASSLGLRRPQPATRCNKRFVQPLFQQLRDARERRGLSRPDIADKIGYHVNQILAWELGKVRPGFDYVVDWANALGFDVVLRPKLQPVADTGSQLAAPDKAKMMAGR